MSLRPSTQGDPSGRSLPPRRLAIGPIALLLVALVACGAGTPAPCASVRFANGVDGQWARAAIAVDFEPTHLCARDRRLRVTAVLIDSAPADGGGFAPRVSQTVARDGEQVLVFSETRAPVPFRAIPEGTRSLVVELDAESGPARSDGEPARGFVGTSASGSAIAYLRWRRNDITHEVAATLRPVFTEGDLIAFVRNAARSR